MTSKEMRNEDRVQMELSKQKSKIVFDGHRLNNVHYDVGEIVIMRTTSVPTGQLTELQNRYRGPLIVTGVFLDDVYRIVELHCNKNSFLATAAHVVGR